MQGSRRREKASPRLMRVFIVVIVLTSLGGSASARAETHAFDPVLSLTGGCKTSAADTVPDPPISECGSGIHPPASFASPEAIATDPYGDIFVASYGSNGIGSEGRIDIFDPQGFYVAEIKDPKGPKNLAVDSKGNLYVFDAGSEENNEVVRYSPIPPYNPEADEISYEKVAVVTKGELSTVTGIAVNPVNNHLFVHRSARIMEYGSVEEANKLLNENIGKGTLSDPVGKAISVAIDAAHKRIYATDQKKIRVFDLETHELVMTIEGSAILPGGEEFSGFHTLAADESTGNFFVFDNSGSNAVYEFSLGGEYLSTIEHGILPTFGGQIAIDNGENSPNGHYLYVPSHPSGVGHSFAFGPEQTKEAPEVKSVSFQNVTENEADLLAAINPGHLETTYSFEYVSKEAFEAEGFANAEVVGGGSIPAGGVPVEVAAAIEGLEAGVTYVFRAVAENEEGSSQSEGEFATYSAPEPSACLNESLRNAFSKLLPDCRAFELVTPPDTNGRTPLAVGFLGTYFATLEASPDGNAASFEIEGGSIPGFEATGSYAGDPYVARRGKEGWGTEYAGPTGEQAPALLPGSNSPDQGFVFWNTANGEGSAAIEEKPTTYLRYPDGHSELIGRGSLDTDPRAEGKLIAEGGEHIIFLSGTIHGPAIRLEENAPLGDTTTIYDRSIDPGTGAEATHVVSLLPNNETPAEGENAHYEGSSLNGKGIAFSIGKTLYLRYADEETYEIGENVTFAGIAMGGKRVFYVKGGNLYAYEVEGEANPIQFSSASNIIPVNIAANGNVAYFISPSTLTGEPNGEGSLPIGGQQNLYRSEEGSLSFVGTVTKRDVDGASNGNAIVDGLGLWTEAVGPGQYGKDPSRTTPNGQVLLFESRAVLMNYDPQGHAEIYRYDAANGDLACISCNPTLMPATSDASLQSVGAEQGSPEPGSSFVLINNLLPDGERAIFQSIEPLVLQDTDDLQDVYEWEAEGVGTCARPSGCVYLISSGHSHRIDYLWSISDSGDDIFFRSSDLLLGIDSDETPSIYDARVDGGFPEPAAEESCAGEGGCWRGLEASPALPIPGSRGPSLGIPGPKSKPCPKGKRKVIRNGKTVCVKKKHSKKHHRKASSKRNGASR